MITLDKAIQSLRPGSEWVLNGNEYDGLNWLDKVQTKPTSDELQAELARLQQAEPLDLCKENAKELIAKTDWAALPDVGLANQDDFIAYRAALRALIINPVANPVWPTEPTPEWG